MFFFRSFFYSSLFADRVHPARVNAAEHPNPRRAAVESEIRNARRRRHFDKREPCAAEKRHAPDRARAPRQRHLRQALAPGESAVL